MTAARTTCPSPDHDGRAPNATQLVGWLADGTPHHAPVGQLLTDGDRVCCHLCGGWYLSVASHLRAHGWTKAEYLAAFGLELANPLAGAATGRRRSAALAARQAHEPRIQRAQADARDRARSGALTAAAAAAATGRPHPPERRVKTLRALSAIRADARAESNRRRGQRQVARTAAEVARRFGFSDLEAYLADRRRAGMSLAAMSREAGLNEHWMSRHAPTLVPALADHPAAPHPGDLRLQPLVARHGLPDVATFLSVRHLHEHRSVTAIAAEAGVSRSAILTAMRRHGIAPTSHATTRHRSRHRDHTVAAQLGFDSLAEYVTVRRSHAVPWQQMVAESGVAGTTLRRYRTQEVQGNGPRQQRVASTR